MRMLTNAKQLMNKRSDEFEGKWEGIYGRV